MVKLVYYKPHARVLLLILEQYNAHVLLLINYQLMVNHVSKLVQLGVMLLDYSFLHQQQHLLVHVSLSAQVKWLWME